MAEDGFLTLRVRTLWGDNGVRHNINLLKSAESPLVLELRHDACGDAAGRWGDALIAFDLRDYSLMNSVSAKITLKWLSFSGEKSLEFSVHELLTGTVLPDYPETEMRQSARIK